MHIPVRQGFGFVVRPSVVFALAWAFGVSVVLIGALITAKWTVDGGPPRLISGTLLAVIAAMNAVLLVALAVDGRAAWRQPAGLRRGPLLGVLFCVANLLLLQWCAWLAYQPVG